MHSTTSALMLMLALALAPVPAASQNAPRAGATTIWLSGDDPVAQLQKHKQTPADYMDLFKPDAPWSNAARSTAVFKISHQFALRASDDQLKTLIADLQRRHIALGIEMGVLQAGPSGCGTHVEGYGMPNAVEDAMKRIQQRGGQLEYVAFDEPVWHGHDAKGRSGSGAIFCSDSLPSLVDQIVPKLAIVHGYFPNAVIGDIEPVHGQHPELVNDTAQFFELLNKKSDVRLTFFHADIAWNAPGWRPFLAKLSATLHARGIRVGVICDGGSSEVKGGEARTNVEWVRTAIQRCQDLVRDPTTKPDELVVQSWEPLPTQMLPETNPGSLTYEVDAVAKLAR